MPAVTISEILIGAVTSVLWVRGDLIAGVVWAYVCTGELCVIRIMDGVRDGELKW